MTRFLAISILLVFSVIAQTTESPFTHIVRTKSELCTMPKQFKNAKELSEGTPVTIVDTTKIYGYIYGKKSPWIKIKTQGGDTGYLLLGEITTLKDFTIEKKGMEGAKNRPLPDFKDYISKSYTDVRQIDTLLHSLEFLTLDSNYSLTSYAYDDNENYCLFLFSKLLGNDGQNPINKLSDVLIVDKRLYKNVSAVTLRDCRINKGTVTGSIIGVYSAKNQDKKNKGEYIPTKSWLANIKTGKIEDFTSSQCRCGPEPVGW
jgi:hypothetical protein